MLAVMFAITCRKIKLINVEIEKDTSNDIQMSSSKCLRARSTLEL